jgi:hypothetical protein
MMPLGATTAWGRVRCQELGGKRPTRHITAGLGTFQLIEMVVYQVIIYVGSHLEVQLILWCFWWPPFSETSPKKSYPSFTNSTLGAENRRIFGATLLFSVCGPRP